MGEEGQAAGVVARMGRGWAMPKIKAYLVNHKILKI